MSRTPTRNWCDDCERSMRRCTCPKCEECTAKLEGETCRTCQEMLASDIMLFFVEQAPTSTDKRACLREAFHKQAISSLRARTEQVAGIWIPASHAQKAAAWQEYNDRNPNRQLPRAVLEAACA